MNLNKKINEYIELGIKLGLFDASNLEEIKAKVSVFANECYNWIMNTYLIIKQ